MITVIIRERIPSNEYKYLIRKDLFGYTAFKTEKGFKRFLEIANIQLTEYTKQYSVKTDDFGIVTSHLIDTVIDEISFWSLNEIPENAKSFKGLSNGSYVDCYYIHTEDGAKIFRPNPNAKEVYKPLSLEEHLEYSSIWG